RWHHVPFGSPGRNRKSARCLSDLRSRAAFDAACTGRRRLSETSSEEDQETGRDVDRIGWLPSLGPPPRSTFPTRHHRGAHNLPRSLRLCPICARATSSLPQSGLVVCWTCSVTWR